MKKGKIIIISGPSGSGKTTLYKKLLAKYKDRLVRSVSVTTRPKRFGEKHGRDYFFVSPNMFEHKRKSGHFLEWEKVFDNFYGTPKKHVRDILINGKNVLLCIDVKGAKAVLGRIPRAVRIFVKTPSLAILEKRLKGRGSETKGVVKMRLDTARKELKEAKNYDHIIVNDHLTHAFKQLKEVVSSELEI